MGCGTCQAKLGMIAKIHSTTHHHAEMSILNLVAIITIIAGCAMQCEGTDFDTGKVFG